MFESCDAERRTVPAQSARGSLSIILSFNSPGIQFQSLLIDYTMILVPALQKLILII